MAYEPLSASRIELTLAREGLDCPVEYHERLGSTNDRARPLIEHGLWSHEAMTCVIADHQSAGRGRRANRWSAPAGAALLMSLICPILDWRRAQGLVALIAALAVARAIEDTYGLNGALKWPNDIRVNRKKIGGVLVEGAGESSARALIFGIGVNVNQTRQDFEADLRETATSVAREVGHGVDRLELLAHIILQMARCRQIVEREGPAPILEAIKRRIDHFGAFVSVADETEAHIEGTALAIDEDGALLVRQTSGVMARCLSGSLTIHP